MSHLHWYGPPYGKRARNRRLYDPPSRWARYRLYHAEVADDGSWNPTGEWTWMGTDCGWEWLATRPGVQQLRPLCRLFDRMHEHVHTPGAW